MTMSGGRRPPTPPRRRRPPRRTRPPRRRRRGSSRARGSRGRYLTPSPRERVRRGRDRPVALALDARSSPSTLNRAAIRSRLARVRVGPASSYGRRSRYCSPEGAHQLVGGQLAAAASVIPCTFWAKSTWSPRGSSSGARLRSGTRRRPSRLRVDADDRLVAPPTSFGSIGRTGRPRPPSPSAPARPSLLDRVLVRAGERRVDELADVRMARVHRQLVAFLDDAPRLVDLREVELGSTPCVTGSARA